MRVFALSDIHVDYAENMAWIEDLSTEAFRGDALILAGDVTHDLERLKRAFHLLLARFRHLFFVPGNHELWVMKGERGNSLDKFHKILQICREMGVETGPRRLGFGDAAAWIVPLFSWYVTPEEGEGTLYLPKADGDAGMKVWSDSYFVRWPDLTPFQNPSAFFLAQNLARIEQSYDAPVISFSHFLGRRDLLFSFGTDMAEVFKRAAAAPHHPTEDGEGFNFSRVAGSLGLEDQIRTLGSKVHIHGHQHRNRYRWVEDVLYVSHCLGYKHERLKGTLPEVEQGPLLVWNDQPGWTHPSDCFY